MSTLELTLVYLLAAVLGVVAFRTLKLPPMLGYLVVGVLIGPHALGVGLPPEALRHLGEFGVVFLMFVIGLEFNLPKLRAMRTHVFGLGLSQVVLTIVARRKSDELFVLNLLFVTLGLAWLTELAGSRWRSGLSSPAC